MYGFPLAARRPEIEQQIGALVLQVIKKSMPPAILALSGCFFAQASHSSTMAICAGLASSFAMRSPPFRFMLAARFEILPHELEHLGKSISQKNNLSDCYAQCGN
jgi:hypothetical protein